MATRSTWGKAALLTINALKTKQQAAYKPLTKRFISTIRRGMQMDCY
jgi:hypothetical protein